MSDQIGYNKPCFAYRAYGSDGRLLYAGITTDVDRRMQEHRGKRWHSAMARLQVDEYPSRWRAALAERAAGRGSTGSLRGGVGKALAAVMTEAELAEVITHRTYAHCGDEFFARSWGMKIAKIRALRAAAVPASTG